MPLIQVFWVNTHGLFVLGPIVLGCYLIERATRRWIGSETPVDAPARVVRSLWWYLIPVSAAVAVACLLNPYGMRGAVFRLELFPKISDPANPYKAYVDEFTSLRRVMRDQMGGAAGAHPHVRTQIFLLLLLPWSFVLPAAWEKWRLSFGNGERLGSVGPISWACGLVVTCGPAIAAMLGVPLPGTPRWLVGISRAAPAIMLVFGVCAAFSLAVRSRIASATMAVGSAALAIWTAWLCSYLFDDGATPYGVSTDILAYVAAGLGALALGLVVHAGGSVFRLLLLATFTYLSFQAIISTRSRPSSSPEPAHLPRPRFPITTSSLRISPRDQGHPILSI